MMEIKEVGLYRLLTDFTFRGSNVIGTSTKGTIIEITQVDKLYKKVIGPNMYDWTHWELPVEKVNATPRREKN